MQEQLGSEIKSIINLVCCKASIGYGGILVIGLGKLVKSDHPKLKNSFFGEFEIRTNNASWRIIRGSELAVGDSDHESCIKLELDSLVGTKLTQVMFESLVSDVKISFENDIILEIFSTSSKDYSWELSGPSFDIEAQLNNHLVKNGPDHIEKPGPYEIEVSIHSEACSNRWKSVIPKEVDNYNCKECCYYKALEGQFHFWDYGLCSNIESNFDGKVVCVKSGCDKYANEFKST